MKQEFGNYWVETGHLLPAVKGQLPKAKLSVTVFKGNLSIRVGDTIFAWGSSDTDQFYMQIQELAALLQIKLAESKKSGTQKLSWWHRFFKDKWTDLGVLGSWKVQVSLEGDPVLVSIQDSAFDAEVLKTLAKRIQPKNRAS
ncbi:MAG TPA: hypothetical protein V6D33_14230 [Cyanophyceae cyanobacterium]